MAAPSLRCLNPEDLFKSQWAYQTPEGYRDEIYLIPFTFQVPGDGSLVKGLPWQLDDDVPFILRGIFFPEIGLGNNLPLTHPGFCRITDTMGNPLSDGLVLCLGSWCLSGWDEASASGHGTAAFGFPIEADIICSPGGTLVFDFRLTTNAHVANTFFGVAGVAGIQFNAGVFGTAGNGRTAQLIDPGAPNIPLSVAAIGNNVQVTLATDGGGAIISTWQQIADLVNSTPAVFAVQSATPFYNTAGVATAAGPSALAGGTASSPITVNGCLLGVKRFKECL